MQKTYEMDMCHGPLLGKILIFSIPLMLSGILQLLFNAADTIVVGRFAGPLALAAVGSTTALVTLLINLFIGFSIGANVLVARFRGANDDEQIRATVHSAIALSCICGIIVWLICFLSTRQILIWMDTPEDVIDQAALYLKILSFGLPANLLYNFGSAILRAMGDTRRPLFYLTLAGVVNVIMNLIFVIIFKAGVAGVALATIISHFISAIMVIRCLMKENNACRLDLSKLKIDWAKTKMIIRIGLPASIQSVVFSFSNILIQSSINSFGSVTMAGNTAAVNIENFIYTSMNTYNQTAMNFSSQNFGARKDKRIHRSVILCMALVIMTGLLTGYGILFASRPLLGLYATDEIVIQYGIRRLNIIARTYFLCGMMDTIVGALRGVGYSILPMCVSLIGACGLRIVWILTVFAQVRTLECLYISYPITWFVTTMTHIICYIIIRRKQLRKQV